MNWEILAKNLVTFKTWDGVKDENFLYYGYSLKYPIFRVVNEKPINRGNCLKRGVWTVCRFKGGEGGGEV